MNKINNYNYLVEKIKDKDEKAINNSLRVSKYDWNYFPENNISLLHLLINEKMTDLSLNVINSNKIENLNLVGIDGFSPLHYAVLNNQNDLISHLLIKGADFEQQSPLGTPLKIALLHYNMEAAYLLILNGADVSEWLNETLFLAILKNNIDMVKLLLSKGADPYYNYLDVSCYMLALKNNHLEILDILEKDNVFMFEAEGLDKEYYETEWFEIIKLNDEFLLKMYIARGVDVNLVNGFGENALDLSYKNNYFNLIDTLKSHVQH